MTTNENTPAESFFPSTAEEIAEMEDREEEIRARELDDERFSSVDDFSDDAEALASAGHGTDEAYNGGCYGDEG